MTKYIKTTTTEFEQLDGWQKTFEKYGIRIESADDLSEAVLDELVPRGRYFLKTLEGELECHIGDWIATGANNEHWPVKDKIFQKEYERLPVIPQYVANMMPTWKVHSSLQEAYFYAGQYHSFPSLDEVKADLWIVKHNDEFARAWLDGYEVAEVEE